MSTGPQVSPEKIAAILENHPEHPGALVNVLHDLQAKFRYLPRSAMEKTALHVGLSCAQVFSVATFYSSFHLKPRGKHICTICMGTACHVRGAPRLLEQAERDLEIKPGGTSADLFFSLEQVNCVGACALGPLAIIDGKYHGNMTPNKLSQKLSKMKKKGKNQWPA
jgi:NADH:ubiquinone oxidoreductase subunit E